MTLHIEHRLTVTFNYRNAFYYYRGASKVKKNFHKKVVKVAQPHSDRVFAPCKHASIYSLFLQLYVMPIAVHK